MDKLYGELIMCIIMAFKYRKVQIFHTDQEDSRFNLCS